MKLENYGYQGLTHVVPIEGCESDQQFVQFVAQVVERHFKDARQPDGTDDSIRDHINRRAAVNGDIEKHVASAGLDDSEGKLRRQYADEQSHSAVTSLYPKITRKPRRYK